MSAVISRLRQTVRIQARFTITLALAMVSPVLAQLAQISHFVSPLYPPLARQAMISGQVALRASIGENGVVTDCVERSSTHPVLAQRAKSCVREWKFQPGADGRTVSVVFYYGFSGTTREINPITSVKADFAGSTIHVYVTTDPFPTVHPLGAEGATRGGKL